MRYLLIKALKKKKKLQSLLSNADDLSDMDLIMNALAVLLDNMD